jgi:hypothetical protein
MLIIVLAGSALCRCGPLSSNVRPKYMNRRTAIAVVSALASRPALALYDPKPAEGLASVQGAWKGTLTYRDYSKPDRLVTLPTRLFVALGSPSALVLHYVFNDGPGKTVFSYETMGFNFDARQITWESGSTQRSKSVLEITSNDVEGDVQSLTFEKVAEGEIERYRMELSVGALLLAKDEVKQGGAARFRNKFEFNRVGV